MCLLWLQFCAVCCKCHVLKSLLQQHWRFVVLTEAKLLRAHLTPREIEFINTMVTIFSHLTHICRGVTASCTIHKFFKLSLRPSHWDSCLSICHLWIVNTKKKTHFGGQIQHVFFVIIVYMLSTVVPLTMATIAGLSFSSALPYPNP